MANIYVRSTDGNNADDGSTWALAKATLAGAGAIEANGDTIYVSHSHAESTAAGVTFAVAGTVASPVKVICGNDGAEPPTAVATSATITTTGNNFYFWSGATTASWVYGLSFVIGSGGTGTALWQVQGAHSFEACNVTLATTGASSRIYLQSVAQEALYQNCGFKFAASGQGFGTVSNLGPIVRVQGGSILAGGTSPSNLVVALIDGTTMTFRGFDMSNASSTMNLSNVTTGGCKVMFVDCKLPPSWSGLLFNGTPGSGSVFELFNCDSGDTTYRYRRATVFGTIQDETTLVRTGGGSDGTTTYGLKMVSNANANYPNGTLDTPECSIRNSAVGSAKTLTVEILRDSVTALTDAEIWLEARYLGTSGVPLGTFVNDAKADVLATAADQTSSSATWTTTGLANPNKQALSVTFTPQEAGYVQFVVKLAKASTTVYVDLAGATLA